MSGVDRWRLRTAPIAESRLDTGFPRTASVGKPSCWVVTLRSGIGSAFTSNGPVICGGLPSNRPPRRLLGKSRHLSSQLHGRRIHFRSKEQRILQQAFCNGFPHFLQIFPDSAKTWGQFICCRIHGLNYGVLPARFTSQTKSIYCGL
jgi:hypothetical protein